jgi:CYTH domain-containing protein
VDEFHGENEGLIVAEIELDDENEEFEIPSWLGKEVTADYRYLNSNLAKNPFSSW